MRVWLLLVLALLVSCVPSEVVNVVPGCTNPVSATGEDVVCVIDGDTIRLSDGDKVRFIGMDTPERGEIGYSEATDALVALINGTNVRFEKDVSDTDKFGRKLRYVYADDTFVNLELVEQGWAVAKDYEPDTLHSDELHAAEDAARDSRVGLWAE